MQFQGAVVKEQSQTFGVVVVRSGVLRDPNRAADMRQLGVQAWGVMPIVLAAQDSSGRFEYQGRRDIVHFLANLHPSQIPWREWSLN